MSFILAQWLNEDLGLETKISPTELDSCLKSGLVLGEILFKLDLQDDYSEAYSRASTLEAYIRNYTHAERTLKDKLGIRISSNEAFDLIQGKSGCAAKLLYQIKSSHARLPEMDSMDKKVLAKKKGKDARLASYPSSPTGTHYHKRTRN